MQELYDLKDMLCKELKEYGEKGELTAGTLDVVDKLTHTMKNLDKIIETYEEEGEGYSNRPYMDGASYRGSNYSRTGRYSNARGRMNARRDSMGRYSRDGYGGTYSRHGDMIADLRDLMEDAPDERTKAEFQRFISKMESM